jgi:hypothetical protein
MQMAKQVFLCTERLSLLTDSSTLDVHWRRVFGFAELGTEFLLRSERGRNRKNEA